MSSRRTRLVVVPLLLFAGVTALTVGLAKAHLASPSAPKAAPGGVKLGDPYRGQTIFQQTCATCHGSDGQGGGGGPQLAGTGITVAAAKAQIESPRGVMPPGLVRGQQEADVLAYLAGILPRH
jgi:mono/diheme cytochrome c family protein